MFNHTQIKTSSSALQYQEDSNLASYFSHIRNTDKKPDYSSFYPLEKGHDALLARLALIESAKHSLDLQYYIVKDDDTGKLLTWRLLKAADRGVKVRILLDDIQQRSDSLLARINGHKNIEIRLFNPHQNRFLRATSYITDLSRLNRRMHNKSMTADSVVSIVGGRNIGNEYFSVASDVEFGDFDLLLHGAVVNEINHQFDQYWKNKVSIPMEWFQTAPVLTPQEVKSWNISESIVAEFTQGKYDFTQLPLYSQMLNHSLEMYSGKITLIYDNPDKVQGSQDLLIHSLLPLLQQTQHTLTIISPYFVPTDIGTKALINEAQKGKKIRVITNSLASNDVFAVHGWYAKYRQPLIEGGVEIWEVKSTANLKKNWKKDWALTGSSRSSLHTKSMIIDNKTLIVGSMNWDPRSTIYNTEMAVVVDSPDYLEGSAKVVLDSLRNNSYQVKVVDGDLVWIDQLNKKEYTSEPHASIWRKIGAFGSGLLPIEDLL